MSSSESDEDNNIRYGTPLEPYEEDEVPSKKKFQRDQTDQHALDAHGRRRFHGAFTGGFSAGFGNSVSTPEGWTPTTFKSTRVEKAKFNNQRPEDFMDEEDRSEFGIAPRLIQTQDDFSGQKRAHQGKRFHDGPIPGEPVLEQLVRTVHESAAVKMLRSMGWRPGQGTGERLTRRGKKVAREQQKVYGCHVPQELREPEEHKSGEETSSSDSEYDYDTLFAPDDYEPYVLSHKSDRFGLGYSGLSRHSVLGNLVGEYGADMGPTTSHLVMKDKGKKVSIRGQAFGVGALEDDDEDIYAKEDMSHYDFVIGAPKEAAKMEKPKQKSNNVLQGFVRAARPPAPARARPPPALPRDYAPAAAGARRSRFEPVALPHRDQGLGRHELSAEARGALLGETPLPMTNVQEENAPQTTAPTTASNEDPIAKLLGRNVDFITTNKTEATNPSQDFIPLNPSSDANLRVFKPFASNPQKQLRYERFVLDKDSASPLEGDGQMDRLSEWERNRELMEFQQAAKLYRPLTGAMGDRFTHASEPDDGALNPLCAVAKSKQNSGAATDEQIDAAAKGLYGTLTRSETTWRPEALVCKRFNVPDPYTTKSEPKKSGKLKTSYSIFEYLETPVHDKASFTKEQSKFSGSKSVISETVPKPEITKNTSELVEEVITEKHNMNTSVTNKRMTVAELFMRESERDMKKTDVSVEKSEGVKETIDKFDKMELYKSIFLSDSESESEREREQDRNKDKDASYTDFVDVPKNDKRNTSPPRGIFANINFDELNSWNRSHGDKEKETEREKKATEPPVKIVKEPVGVIEVDTYGPKLPDYIIKKTALPSAGEMSSKDIPKPVFVRKEDRDIHVVDSSSSADSWVDVKAVKSKKSKKKKSKHKKHKTKHKKSKH